MRHETLSARQATRSTRGQATVALPPRFAAKLLPPMATSCIVTREHLVRKIVSARQAKLTLLHAPAGFGKTMAMRQCHEALERAGEAVAWLTLDAMDDDAEQFRLLLCAALDGAAPDASRRYSRIGILDRIASCARRLSIFIDGFESIRNIASLDLVRELVECSPYGVRLIVASRLRPDLDLAKWRTRGQLLDIGPAQLLLTQAEIRDALVSRRPSHIDDEGIMSIWRNTEGWPAAVGLVTQALDDGDRAIIDCSLHSAAVLNEFFAEEVVVKLPRELRAFLADIRALPRFNAALCDVVRGRADSAALLEELEHRHALLVPVGVEHWFRLWTPLAEHLRASPYLPMTTSEVQINRVASAWFVAAGQPICAIEHALAARDFSAAIQLIESEADALLLAGRMRLLRRWLDAIPQPDLNASPRLLLAHAWVTALTRGHAAAVTMLDHVGSVLAACEDVTTDLQVLHVTLLTMQDRNAEAVALGGAVLKQSQRLGRFAHAMLRNIVAQALLAQGQADTAVDMLEAAASDDFDGKDAFRLAHAQCVKSVFDMMQGRLHSALGRLRLAVKTGCRTHHATNGNVLVAVRLAQALYESGSVDETETLLRDSLPALEHLCLPDPLSIAYVCLVRIAQQAGDAARVYELLARMEHHGERTGRPRIVAAARLERARVDTLAGDFDGARRALRGAQALVDWSAIATQLLMAQDVDTWHTAELRLLVHTDASDQAVPRLNSLLGEAEKAGRLRRALQLRLLLALALFRLDRRSDAFDTLDAALRVAAREGYVSAFVDEGEAMQVLLREFHALRMRSATAQSEKAIASFLNVLLAMPPDEKPAALVKPLTNRELQLLTMLAEGCSNSEIAAQLGVADTTVRTHLRRINVKLNVQSRTQAVAVARRLRLIA